MLIEEMSSIQLQTDLLTIRQDLLDGLCSDGAHHKQYYLDQALRKICTLIEENFIDLISCIPDYDAGIAPQNSKRNLTTMADYVKYTDPATLPLDICEKLVACRNAMVLGDIHEAWHQLYLIADPECLSISPWAKIERKLQN